VERGLRRQKIVPQASACCAKSQFFSDFPGVDPAQQQVRLNVTGVLLRGFPKPEKESISTECIYVPKIFEKSSTRGILHLNKVEVI